MSIVEEMISAFDMKKFLQSNEEDQPNGAFAIITDQQVILSYTENHGRGLHYDAISKALCEIMEEDKDEDSLAYLRSVSAQYFIVVRMINELDLNYIIFELNFLRNITPNQLSLFEKFMNQYNSLVSNFSKERGRPTVLVELRGKELFYDDLEPIYDYLKTIVDENRVIPQELKVIGEITLDSNEKKEKI